MLRAKLSFVLCAVCLTIVPAVASADDFAPPPWSRLHPNAITAEWEFFTPANPATPDGPLTNVGAKGTGSVVTVADIEGFAGLGWGPDGTVGPEDDGNWFFPGGGRITFTVDNVIDLEPVKHIRLQITHSLGLGVSVDPMGTFNMGATGSIPTVPVIISDSSPFHTLIVWDMFPNPPWERFSLEIANGGEIDQIVIDTISTGSVPEHSTVVSFGLVLLTVGAIAWKRPRFLKLVSG